jgi:hypothetical protein
MWAMLAFSNNNYINNDEFEIFKSYGTIIGSLMDSVSSILKSLISFVMLQSEVTGENNLSGKSKEDAHGVLDAIYKTRIVGCLVETFRY